MPEGAAGLRVGVVSDTHGLLRPELLDLFAGVDYILHAGDIGRPGLVERLREVAPVTAIRGNVDRGDWAAPFPERVTVVFGGFSIHMVHDPKDLGTEPLDQGLGLIVVGHTHRPSIQARNGAILLNPGSAGPRRFRLPVTAATLLIAGGRLEPQIHPLLP